MAKPVDALCDQTYTAVHTSGVRKPEDVRWIVLHSAEGDTAKGTAIYFTTQASGGSAHLCVDDDECYRTLRNIDIPWAAPGANTAGLHIEQAGHAAWTSAQWRKHDMTLRRAAYKTALHCDFFGIPTTFRTHLGLRRNLPGITTHWEVTQAFSDGVGHTDPGKGWPRDLFMRYVREYAVGEL